MDSMGYMPENEMFDLDFEGDLLMEHLYSTERAGRVMVYGLQLDEMWPFVGEKKRRHWIWLAFNPPNRQIVAFHVGGRGKKDAAQFLDNIPEVFRRGTGFFTDYWGAYRGAINDGERHFAVGKQSGMTAYIERFNCTLRQRASRLVRKALSFSKPLQNHIGDIKYFICHYNQQIRALHL
jgi:insertion element IS1 protein InsB